MTDYIEREALLERIDDIWDCADLVFEPNDHCCRADDCASCKWAETKKAIRKIAANFPAADVVPVGAYNQVAWERDTAIEQLKQIGKSFGEQMDDVRPVVRGKWIPVGTDDMDEGMYKCSECGSEHFFPDILFGIPADNFCPNCGADMRGES